MGEGHFVQQQDLAEHESVREGAVHVLDRTVLGNDHVAQQFFDGGGGTEVIADQREKGVHAVLFHREGLAGRRHSFDQGGDVVEQRVLHDTVTQLRLLGGLEEWAGFLQGSHATVRKELVVLPIPPISLQRLHHLHTALGGVEEEAVRRAVDGLDQAILQLEGKRCAVHAVDGIEKELLLRDDIGLLVQGQQRKDEIHGCRNPSLPSGEEEMIILMNRGKSVGESGGERDVVLFLANRLGLVWNVNKPGNKRLGKSLRHRLLIVVDVLDRHGLQIHRFALPLLPIHHLDENGLLRVVGSPAFTRFPLLSLKVLSI